MTGLTELWLLNRCTVLQLFDKVDHLVDRPILRHWQETKI